MFRLILAIITGYLLGYERKKKDKSGGSRTMSLICTSACLVAIVSLDISSRHTLNLFRLMQGFIQGVGFIGMGLIFKNKGHVEGLTTASCLLMNVVIGFLYGLGYFLYAMTSAVFSLIILESKYWKSRRRNNE